MYVADAVSLGVTGATRAEVAKKGCDRDDHGGLGSRDRFRLLNAEPLTARDGRVTMTELFPRSLRGVQFLRIVPVSAQGREAEFADCRAIPVAVPTDRRPPAPRVRARVDPARAGATVTVDAVGLDLVALEAVEPGLLADPPAADAGAPEYRIRRSMTPVTDPLFAREIGHGVLSRVDTEAVEPGLLADPPAADAGAPEYRIRRSMTPVTDPPRPRDRSRRALARRHRGRSTFHCDVRGLRSAPALRPRQLLGGGADARRAATPPRGRRGDPARRWRRPG